MRRLSVRSHGGEAGAAGFLIGVRQLQRGGRVGIPGVFGGGQAEPAPIPSARASATAAACGRFVNLCMFISPLH